MPKAKQQFIFLCFSAVFYNHKGLVSLESHAIAVVCIVTLPRFICFNTNKQIKFSFKTSILYTAVLQTITAGIIPDLFVFGLFVLSALC